MSETAYAPQSLDTARAMLEHYRAKLAGWKPETYEVFIENAGGTYRLSDAVRVTLDALAAAERELEGVKRVEAWLMQQPLTHYITRNYDGHYEATAAGRVVPNTEAQSPTLAALGHALPDDTAQEGR